MTSVESSLSEDGDRYFRVNGQREGRMVGPVMERLAEIHSSFPLTSVLEVGCSNGYRLAEVKRLYACGVLGIEVAPEPVSAAHEQFPEIEVMQGYAPRALRNLEDRTFDCVILGFFIYLLPREELFELAHQVDRILETNGHIVVMDFLMPYPTQGDYRHSAGLSVFKDDPSRVWTWNPSYALIARSVYPLQESSDNDQPGNWTVIDVIRKLPTESAYAANT